MTACIGQERSSGLGEMKNGVPPFGRSRCLQLAGSLQGQSYKGLQCSLVEREMQARGSSFVGDV